MVARAIDRIESDGAWIYAAVKPNNTQATTFWESLGLERDEAGTDPRSILFKALARDVLQAERAARAESGDGWTGFAGPGPKGSP